MPETIINAKIHRQFEERTDVIYCISSLVYG